MCLDDSDNLHHGKVFIYWNSSNRWLYFFPFSTLVRHFCYATLNYFLYICCWCLCVTYTFRPTTGCNFILLPLSRVTPASMYVSSDSHAFRLNRSSTQPPPADLCSHQFSHVADFQEFPGLLASFNVSWRSHKVTCSQVLSTFVLSRKHFTTWAYAEGKEFNLGFFLGTVSVANSCLNVGRRGWDLLPYTRRCFQAYLLGMPSVWRNNSYADGFTFTFNSFRYASKTVCCVNAIGLKK